MLPSCCTELQQHGATRLPSDHAASSKVCRQKAAAVTMFRARRGYRANGGACAEAVPLPKDATRLFRRSARKSCGPSGRRARLLLTDVRARGSRRSERSKYGPQRLHSREPLAYYFACSRPTNPFMIRYKTQTASKALEGCRLSRHVSECNKAKAGTPRNGATRMNVGQVAEARACILAGPLLNRWRSGKTPAKRRGHRRLAWTLDLCTICTRMLGRCTPGHHADAIHFAFSMPPEGEAGETDKAGRADTRGVNKHIGCGRDQRAAVSTSAHRLPIYLRDCLRRDIAVTHSVRAAVC
jgi:hypothetical protein